MIPLLPAFVAVLSALAEQPASDPSAAAPPRQPIGFKVFKNIDAPVTGRWDLEIPGAAARRIEIRELVPGNQGVLVGSDPASGDELLRLERRKEGIGYQGQILKIFGDCGLEVLPVTEYFPLGDSAVLRFETRPTDAACPPLDGGGAGTLRIVSSRGGPVRLRDHSEISGQEIRETYGIGGERQSTVSTSYSLTGVSVEPGSEVRLVQRFRAPLDRSLWFEVEAIVAADAASASPRGYVRSESLNLVGSLSLKRVP